MAPESFRPGFGRWLTVGFAMVCALAAIASLGSDGASAMLSLWPWLALLTGGCWALFWQPCVRLDDDGIELVNVWHSVRVPWRSLVGVDTAWALTLVTAENRYRAWAAPAPGRSIMRGTEQPDTHRIRDAAIGGEVRPGDLPQTDSGAAAVLVRKHWSAQRTSGKLDEGILINGVETAGTVKRTIHWQQMVIASVLAAVALTGIQ